MPAPRAEEAREMRHHVGDVAVGWVVAVGLRGGLAGEGPRRAAAAERVAGCPPSRQLWPDRRQIRVVEHPARPGVCGPGTAGDGDALQGTPPLNCCVELSPVEPLSVF